MEETDKLTCREEILDVSDVENSTTDEHTEDIPKKKKRRRREIDMIKISDDDDSEEESGPKKMKRLSPGPNSPASHREPRTCVLKASQKRRPLSRLLEQLLRNLEKKDPHQFFAWPVNDNFAPNYSNIIRRPMDFSTIKQKIDDNVYRSLNCFINDFKLMCNNAMKYNKAGTVYHKAARRLLHSGQKQLTPAKLRPLGNILTYMYEIPIRELGFDIGKMDLHKVLKRGSPIKSGGEENDVQSDSASSRQDSGDNIKISQMEAARERNRRRLAKKAFPRMDATSRTTLCLLGAGVGAGSGAGAGPPGGVGGAGAEGRRLLKHLVPRLTLGSGALHTPREDRRNLVKGVKPLNYGPFSSYAPSYDGTFATLTKEQSHLLYHTLPSETGEGNEELLRFAPDSPWTLFYDMEAMFPSKKPAAEPEQAAASEQTDISSLKVDIESLKSLSELGIDMEFLADMEDDIIASQQDYGINSALQNTLQLLIKLEKEQRERLSAPPPPHLASLPRAAAPEREAARAALAGLRAMLARVPPRALVARSALRQAMGVTLSHLDTPVPVDEFIELDMCESRPDAGSDSSHDCK